jgi:hypothetical protein
VSRAMTFLSLRMSQMKVSRNKRALAERASDSPALVPPSGLRLLESEEDLRTALQRVAEFERARGRYERAMAGRSTNIASR